MTPPTPKLGAAPTHIALPLGDAQKLIDFLKTQSYADVHQLVQSLLGAERVNLKREEQSDGE